MIFSDLKDVDPTAVANCIADEEGIKYLNNFKEIKYQLGNKKMLENLILCF